MKINEKNVLKEMEDIAALMKSAYLQSRRGVCDGILNRAIGKIDTLMSILSKTEEYWIAINSEYINGRFDLCQ